MLICDLLIAFSIVYALECISNVRSNIIPVSLPFDVTSQEARER